MKPDAVKGKKGEREFIFQQELWGLCVWADS